MYNPGMTISIGATGNPANGSIHVIDVGTDAVMLDITTPWGELYTGGTTYINVGETLDISKFATTIPFKEFRYIIRLLSVVPYTSATFQVLSFAYDESVLSGPGGTNLLVVTDNYPPNAQPGSDINYNLKITNNSSSNITFRYIFATKTDIAPSIKSPLSLPPIGYKNINCWYDKWGTGNCVDHIIGPGIYYDITGTISMPTAGTREFTLLGVFVYIPNYWGSGKHEYVSPRGLQSGWLRSINIDRCAGVICPDKCIGPDLYLQTCDPTTGNCVQGALKEANSPICIATHFVEYDFSVLPADFLNMVSSNIVFISDKLGGYLPLGNNIQYVKTIYDSGEKKFRIYFKYTPSLSVSSIILEDSSIVLRDVRYIYNSSTGSIETLVLLTDMASVAAYVTGILILALVLILGLISPWIAIFGIALGVALLYYKLVEIETGGESTGSGPITPADRLGAVADFVDNYLSPTCEESYPTCAADPPTCDHDTMRAYLSCINNARLSQCRHAKATANLPITECNAIRDETTLEDDCLANRTCTPEEAKNRSTTIIVNPVKEIIKETIKIVTCPSGQEYNKDTQKCEDICWIPNPIGGCILTIGTRNAILLTGGLLLGGYVAYKIATRPKIVKEEKK